MISLGLVAFLSFAVAAVLYAFTGADEASVSIWGHFFVAVGLALTSLIPLVKKR